MNTQLQELLARARTVAISPQELEEQRIQIVAANGYLTDKRITVDAVKATRTIMLASEQPHSDRS